MLRNTHIEVNVICVYIAKRGTKAVEIIAVHIRQAELLHILYSTMQLHKRIAFDYGLCIALIFGGAIICVFVLTVH